MEPTEGFAYFTAIVEAKSISGAARALGIPRATLSRRLSELEASLGVRLLHRSTRRLVPTPAGEELYRRASRILSDAREARDAVRRLDGVPRGLLRVSTLSRIADVLAPLVLEYMELYPETQIEVMSASRVVDLVGEGFDVAIRAGAVHDSDLIARKVGSTDVFPIASPGYLARHGTPTTAEELQQHVCLMGYVRSEAPMTEWPLREGGSVQVHGRLAASELELLCLAAVAGLGIAVVPQALSQPHLESGALVPVLRDVIGVEAQLSLVYVSREFMEPKVRAFIDLAVEHLRGVLQSDGIGGVQAGV